MAGAHAGAGASLEQRLQWWQQRLKAVSTLLVEDETRLVQVSAASLLHCVSRRDTVVVYLMRRRG